MELLTRPEVSKVLDETIDDALGEFRARHEGVKVLAWYHDIALWYAKESIGDWVRRLQLALVRESGQPFLELTGDFQVRDDRSARTPVRVNEPLLRNMSVDELTPVDLLAAMEEVWQHLSEDQVAVRSFKLARTDVAPLAAATQRETEPVEALLGQLTERERAVLNLLASGTTSVEMAQRLGISRNTVRTYVQSVLAKLGVHSRLEAAAMAARSGWTPPKLAPRARRAPNKYSVAPTGSKWVLRHGHEVLGSYPSRDDAVEAGRRAAKRNPPSQVVVRDPEGGMRTEWTFGQDAFPPSR